MRNQTSRRGDIDPPRAADAVLLGKRDAVSAHSDAAILNRAVTLSHDRDALIEALHDRSPLAKFIVGPDGCIASWNAAAECLLGYRAEEVIGSSSSILMPLHFLAKWEAARKSIFEQTTVVNDSVRRHKSGRLIEVEVTATAIGNRSCGPSSYLVILRDKSTERTIQSENARLASIVRTSPMAIVGLDTNSNIQSWNTAATELFGYELSEAIGKSIYMLIPDRLPDDTVERSIFQLPYVSQVRQVWRCDKRGREIPVTITGSAITNGAGVAIGAALFFNDNTVEIESRRRLENAEEFSRSILETSQDWIMVVDAENRVRYCNQDAHHARLTNTLDALCGRNLHDLWPRDQAEVVEITAAEARVSGLARNVAMRRDAGGRAVWHDILMTRIASASHGPSSLLFIARDVTQQKAHENHIEFVAKELSHRVKNILAVILGMMCSTTEQSRSVEQFAETLRQRIQGLSRSHDLLTQNSWGAIDLHSLVRNQLQPFIFRSSTRLTLEGPNVQLPPTTAQALGIALNELATNAAKYGALSASNGQIVVSCSKDGARTKIQWTELHGPPVSPPTRTGFGRLVLEDMVRESMSAEVMLKFEKTGLVWSVTLPYSLLG